VTAPAEIGQEGSTWTSRVRDHVELAFFGLLALSLAVGFVFFTYIRPVSASEDAIAIHQGTYDAPTLPSDQASTSHDLPSVHRGEVTIVVRHNWGAFGEERCDAYRVSGNATVSRSSWDAEGPCSAERVAHLLNVRLE
jgi:hypothetical protein